MRSRPRGHLVSWVAEGGTPSLTSNAPNSVIGDVVLVVGVLVTFGGFLVAATWYIVTYHQLWLLTIFSEDSVTAVRVLNPFLHEEL